MKHRRMCAMRGRQMIKQERSEYGKQIRKDYESGEIKEKRANIQQFEIRRDGISNTITTVSKDTLTIGKWEKDMIVDEKTNENIEELSEPKIEDYLYKDYGVFKLSPLECLRLQGVRDEDAKKMLSANSSSQCYKQAGNSICVPVLMALFSQLNIKNIKAWNDMTEDERMALVDTTRDWDVSADFSRYMNEPI